MLNNKFVVFDLHIYLISFNTCALYCYSTDCGKFNHHSGKPSHRKGNIDLLWMWEQI